MNLRDLDAKLVRRKDDAGSTQDVTSFAEADGILFDCPCRQHSVLVWFVGRDVPPGEKAWTAAGSSLDDLTLNPSINFPSGCWHGFVRNGQVTS